MNEPSLPLTLIPAWLQTILLITGASIFTLTEWRLAMIALLAQYLAAGLLLVADGMPAAAGSLILSGAIACAIVYISARAGSGDSLKVRQIFADWLLRIVTVALMAVGVFGVIRPSEWLMIPAASLTAAVWLAAVGLLVVALSRQAFRIGLGLLTFETGFFLLYAHLDGGLVVIGLLAGVNLMLALVVSTVAQMWSAARL